MFTTGSRFFFGLSVLGLIGALAYGANSDWEPFGLMVLASVSLASFFLGCLAFAYRDASVPASVGASSAADAEGEYGKRTRSRRAAGRARRRFAVDHRHRPRHRALRLPCGHLPARRGDDRVDGAGVVRPRLGQRRVQPVAPRSGAPAARVPALRAPRWRHHRHRVLAVLLSISKDAAVIVFIIFGSALLLERSCRRSAGRGRWLRRRPAARARHRRDHGRLHRRRHR